MTRKCLAPLLLLLLSLLGHAQDYGDPDDDDTEEAGSASLSLRFDRLGGAQVNFGLPERPNNWEAIRASVAAALHCPEQRFVAPELSTRTQEAMDGWTAARRDSYLRFFADCRRRELSANCSAVLGWNRFAREGSFDLSTVASLLRQAGQQQLWVSIFSPDAKLVEFSKENLSYPPREESRFLAYRILLNGAVSPAPIRLSFGVSQQKVYRSLEIALAFVLVPIAITLYMRRAALASGKVDPTAAWFSYFRTINWCINGAMLLWITSGLGARQALQDCISYAIAPGWIATLLDVAIVIGPAFLVYFICVAVSYPLHVQLRGTTWTRGEFLVQQLVTVGAQALPLMFFLAAIGNITRNGNGVAVFFLCALFTWILFRSLKMQVTKSYPHPLTRGELRDKVFAIAKNAGVHISQIFVLPTGKSQVANAFASGNRVVMFTDYLLEHLTKREVEGVAAHEIAHLQLGHVKKRALTLYGALMLPPMIGGFAQGFIDVRSRTRSAPIGVAAHLYSGVAWFWQWSQRDFILMLLAFMVFYFVSRRYEYAADNRGAELTGDPEAQISGLLKLSRLNLMPIQWGKGTGTWLTHPSTLRRAERIAASSGMPAEKLQAILEQYRTEVKFGRSIELAGNDHYAIPEAADPKNLLSAAKKQNSRQFRLWTSLLMHVIPPALFAQWVQVRHLEGNSALIILGLGAITAPIVSIAYSAWLGVLGRRAQRTRLAERLQREGAIVKDSSVAIGFSPGAVVRFYTFNYYNWDIGFLELSSNGLSYRGEQVRFSIAADQIQGICLGQGGPSWWKFPRVYVRWKDSAGTPSVFNIASLEPCSIWNLGRQAETLCRELQALRSSHTGFLAPTEATQPPPSFAEITSQSPRELGGLKTNLTLMIFLLPLAAAANAILRSDSLWYVFGVVALTRLVESIPFWRFRDRVLSLSNQSLETAVAAKANEG
jgi:Zn-dependent protease with chaperone function